MLVEYSDSEGSDNGSKRPGSTDTTVPSSLKRKRSSCAISDLPPLPSNFHDLYASNARASTRDDPELHGGRQRAIPHVEGNWPSHVYLEWYPSQTESNQLSTLISTLRDLPLSSQHQVNSLLKSDLGTELPLHISLSRPILLLTDQREPFIKLLESQIHHLSLQSHTISPTTVDWVSNFDRSRWFLVLRLARLANNELNKLLYVINHTVEVFGQPPLYAEPSTHTPRQLASLGNNREKKRPIRGRSAESLVASVPVHRQDHSSHFHVSIGWTLEEPPSSLIDATRNVALANIKSMQIPILAVKVKIGNAVTAIHLSKEATKETGILGM